MRSTLHQSVVARLPQPTDGHPLPVLASANIVRLGPAGGVITLELPGRAGAGADRRSRRPLPGLAGPRPGVRRRRREPARDRARRRCSRDVGARRAVALGPGAAEATLSKQPFAALQLDSRRDLQSQLSSQPLARGITVTLGAAGLVALLLAAIGVWVTLVSDARDERGELFDLEAQGVAARDAPQPAAPALGRAARRSGSSAGSCSASCCRASSSRWSASPRRRRRPSRRSSPTPRGARPPSALAVLASWCSGSRS